MVAQTSESMAQPWEPTVPSGSEVGAGREVGGGGGEEHLSSLLQRVCSGKLRESSLAGGLHGAGNVTKTPLLPSVPKAAS